MTDRIRVIQIITGLGRGGAERFVLDLVETIDHSRFDVKIIGLNGKKVKALEAYGYSDMPVTIIDIKGSPAKGLIQLRRFIADFHPHIIHAHMFHALAASVIATALRHKPVKLCFTGHRTVNASARELIIRMLKPYRSADIIFTPDQHPHLNIDRTIVIPNGVFVTGDLSTRTPWCKPSDLRLLSVGRLIDVKDCLGLVRSFDAADIPGATLAFVGTGPMEKDIRELSAQLGLGERIRLLGFKTNIRELLNEADIFVMHSRQEGMPMALLEAGAEAMPVISTPVGAIPDILGDDRGVLANPQDFAKALQKLVNNPDAALEMGQRLKNHVAENYSIAATTRAHEELYENIYR